MREDHVRAGLMHRRHVQVTWGPGTGTGCGTSKTGLNAHSIQYTVL